MNKTKFSSNSFKKIEQQKGWTLWSLIFVIGVLILFTYVGFQLVPVYTTNGNITKAMQLSLDNVSSGKVSRAAIIKTIDAQLYLDGTHELLDYKTDLDVKRTQRELVVQVNYERRVELFYNLSIVATFNNEVKKDL